MSPYAIAHHLDEALEAIEDGKRLMRRRREQRHIDIYELIERKIRAAKSSAKSDPFEEALRLVDQYRKAEQNANATGSLPLQELAEDYKADLFRFVDCWKPKVTL